MDKINLNGVDYVRAVDVVKDVEKTQQYQDLFGLTEYIIGEITRLESDAGEIYNEVKEAGLAFNTIESEGYLRAMRTVVNMINHAKDDIFPTVKI